MTRVIIEGLVDRQSLLTAISLVLQALNHDDAYLKEELVFTPGGHAALDPIGESQGQSHQQPPLTPYTARGMARVLGLLPLIPCPRRGTHTRLTDCWLCWSDVMRGAILEPEVLTTEAWTDGLEFRGKRR
jgi:hypothetical protein